MPPEPDLRDLPVLVVDDHPRARDVVAGMLSSKGLAAGSAESGHAAIAAVAAAAASGKPFALVLLDAEMDDLDGFETAAEIAALGLDASPRIVLMIGAWGEEVTDEARQVGVEYLLPKPFTPSLLVNIIGHALHDPEGGSLPEAEPLAAAPGVPEEWLGRAVLLVEDNELNQEVALGLLGDFGLAVELAADGAAAVDKVLARVPGYFAAVLMDMQMPVMDGLFLRYAKEIALSHQEKWDGSGYETTGRGHPALRPADGRGRRLRRIDQPARLQATVFAGKIDRNPARGPRQPLRPRYSRRLPRPHRRVPPPG